MPLRRRRGRGVLELFAHPPEQFYIRFMLDNLLELGSQIAT